MNRARVLLLVVAGALFLTGSLWADETTVGGEIFTHWNLDLNDQTIVDSKQVKNYNNFEVTRAWLDLQHVFSEKYSARITTNVYEMGEAGAGDMYVQYAYLQINKLLPYTDFRFGLQGQAWVMMVDETWGMRWVDVASLERFGFLEFADFGATLEGTCPGDWGTLTLQVLNGTGRDDIELNKYKDIALYAKVTPLFNYEGWEESAIFGQYYYGFPNVEDVPGVSVSDRTKKERLSAAGRLSYKDWFVAYVDYFQTSDDDNIAGQPEGSDFPEEDKAKGATVFGKLALANSGANFLSDIYLFGKYQYVDLHTDHTAASIRLFAEEGDAKHILAGAAYELTEGFQFALTFRRTTTDRIEYDEEDEPLRIAETERNFFMFNMMAKF
jgi:hypothetical protein